MIWPFLWPKGSVALQLCVLVCIVLLVAGRVANLFLPIYYKKIGELMYLHFETVYWLQYSYF